MLLISIYDNRIQSIDPVENYSYGTGKDLICKYEKNQWNNVIKQCKKMVNFDDFTK